MFPSRLLTSQLLMWVVAQMNLLQLLASNIEWYASYGSGDKSRWLGLRGVVPLVHRSTLNDMVARPESDFFSAVQFI